METNQKCCAFFGAKHKKFFAISFGVILFAIIALAVSSVGWKMRQMRNGGYGLNGNSRCSGMMGSYGKYCGGQNAPDQSNQFVLPQDALKSGEIAVVVSDLETAKKAVTDASLKNGGSVYATFISYATNNLKNGSIVVQVPAGNFESAFADLKKIGTQVIQESTQQIAPNNYYYPMATAERPVSDSVSSEEDSATTTEEVAKPEIAIYPAPTQLAQDKGYIKVIFADYGLSAKKVEKSVKKQVVSSIINVGNPTDQNMKNNLFVIVGVKLIFLIAVLGLLFVVFKKIFQAIRTRKGKITKIHVVRQMTKTHKRVVKIAGKKKKK